MDRTSIKDTAIESIIINKPITSMQIELEGSSKMYLPICVPIVKDTTNKCATPMYVSLGHGAQNEIRVDGSRLSFYRTINTPNNKYAKEFNIYIDTVNVGTVYVNV